MSDIRCAVCSEPWDTHHLRYDAPAWVRPLFYAGAGCESCEGVAPEGRDDRDLTPYLAHVADRVTGPDDDDVTAGTDYHPRTRPQWIRPVDTVVWECAAGCGVKVKRNQEWSEGQTAAFYVDGCKSYYQERDLRVERDNEFPSLSDATIEISLDGANCKLCVTQCRDCETLLATEEHGDYQRGLPCPDDEYSPASLCEDCYSACEFEVAVNSYDQRDLVRALGYDPKQGVGARLMQYDIKLFEAERLRIAEIEGSDIRYRSPVRSLYPQEVDRAAKARILRAVRSGE